MAVPYLGKALKGWTKWYTITKRVQTIVNTKATYVDTTVKVKMNIQPTPPQKVDKKPEGDRNWQWWSGIVTEGEYFKKGDLFTVDGKPYKIMNCTDWSESGFQKYEAIEDYTS